MATTMIGMMMTTAMIMSSTVRGCERCGHALNWSPDLTCDEPTCGDWECARCLKEGNESAARTLRAFSHVGWGISKNRPTKTLLRS